MLGEHTLDAFPLECTDSVSSAISDLILSGNSDCSPLVGFRQLATMRLQRGECRLSGNRDPPLRVREEEFKVRLARRTVVSCPLRFAGDLAWSLYSVKSKSTDYVS